MNKYIKVIVLISSFFFSSFSFANQDSNLNLNAPDLLKILPSAKFSSLSKEQNYMWLVAVLLIGRKVEIISHTGMLYANEGLIGSVVVPKAASNIKVTIADEKGAVLKSIDLGTVKAGGIMEFKWDGMLTNDSQAASDVYQISANAVVDSHPVTFLTTAAFKVKSLSADSDDVVLDLDKMGGIRLREIIKIL